jgi:hypothetical protein
MYPLDGAAALKAQLSEITFHCGIPSGGAMRSPFFRIPVGGVISNDEVKRKYTTCKIRRSRAMPEQQPLVVVQLVVSCCRPRLGLNLSVLVRFNASTYY